MPTSSRPHRFWVALATFVVSLLSWYLFVASTNDHAEEKVIGPDSSQTLSPTEPSPESTPADRVALAEEGESRASLPPELGELVDFRGAVQLWGPQGEVTKIVDGDLTFADGSVVGVHAGEFTILDRVGATREIEEIRLGSFFAQPREARLSFANPADVLVVVADIEMLGELSVRSSLDLPITDVAIAFSSSRSFCRYPTDVEHQWTGLPTPTLVPKFRYWTRGQVFWVSARGHGWKRFEHPGDATPRSIVLDPAGELSIEVRGAGSCAELGDVRIEREGESVTEMPSPRDGLTETVVLQRFPVGECSVQTLLRKGSEPWEAHNESVTVKRNVETHLLVDLCSVETAPAFARLEVEIDLRNWLGDPNPILSIQPVSTSVVPKGGGVFSLAQLEELSTPGIYRWRSERMEEGEWRVTLTSTMFNELISLDPSQSTRVHWELSSTSRLDVVLEDAVTGAPLTDGFIEWVPVGEDNSISFRWQSSPGTYTLVGSPHESVNIAAYHSGFVPSIQLGVSAPSGATRVVMPLRRAPKIEISLVDEVGGEFLFKRWGEIQLEGPGHVVWTETSSTEGAGWAMLQLDQPGIYRIGLPEIPDRKADPQEVSVRAGEIAKVSIVVRPAD